MSQEQAVLDARRTQQYIHAPQIFLRDIYKYVLYLRADELDAYVWSRTLGMLQMAKEDVIADRRKPELCDECGHEVSLHEAEHGCDYEADRPDADIGQIAWRCCCKARKTVEAT